MNVDWLSHLPAPARRVLYFGLQRAIGSRVGSCWRQFLVWERYSEQQLAEAVEKRLRGLLDGAVQHSAYYRELNLHRAAGESALSFLTRFPILTRETIRQRFASLVADPLRGEITSPESVSSRRYDWVVVKTGGTTGVPTSVIHDARGRDWGRASRLYAQRLCGFPLGTRYFKLWGSEQDLWRQEDKLDRRVLRNLLGEIPMNAFRAKENELLQHWQAMQARPGVRHLMAYVDAAASLAGYLKDRQLPAPKIETIMACAGTVTAEWRQLLQETFQAGVFDKYGSRECSDIACECSRHTGLHLFSPCVYAEVVDENGQACAPGQTGRLLITMLNNASFPMIRYQIGDLAQWAEPGPCPCGSPFPRLQSLQGRADDMLLTQDGTWLSSVFIRHFVGVSLNKQLIREWQFEQTGRNEFVFRYVPLQPDGLKENLEQLRASFQKALGVSARIQLEQVVEIPPSPTGKTLWILNRLKRNPDAAS